MSKAELPHMAGGNVNWYHLEKLVARAAAEAMPLDPALGPQPRVYS